MRTPHLVRLVEIDEQRFITGCRNGIVHLTWGRTTIRFTAEEFRRLADLLEEARDPLTPSSLRDGYLRVTCRRDEECEFRMGPLALLLSPAEFRELAAAAREAVDRLDEILDSGAWDEPDEEESAPFDSQDLFGRTPFSQN